MKRSSLFRRLSWCFVAFLVASRVVAAGATEILTLSECVKMALERGNTAREINLTYDNSFLSFRQSRARKRPSLDFQLSTPGYESRTRLWRRFPGEPYTEWQERNLYTYGSLSAEQEFFTNGSLSLRCDFSKSQHEYLSPYPSEDNLFQTNFLLEIEQPILSFNSFRATQEKADLSLEQANITRLESRNDLVYQVVSSYYELLLAGETERLKQESLARARKREREAEEMYRKGLMPRLEYLQIKVDLANEEVALIGAERDLQSKSSTLEVLLGSPGGGSLRISGEIELFPQEYRKDEVFRTITEVSPSLASLKHTLSEREIDLTEAKWQRIPTLTMNGAVGWAAEGSYIEDGKDNFHHNLWEVGLQLSYPIYDGGVISAGVGAAHNNLELAEMDVRNRIDELRQSVEEAFRTFEEYEKKIGIYSSSVDIARQNVEIVNLKFEKGLAKLSEVLEIEETYHETLASYKTVLFERNLLILEMKMEMGEDLRTLFDLQSDLR